jgi:DNA polymerase elongation subunit (family B)
MSERSKLVVKKYFRLFDYNVYDDGMYATDKTFTIQMFGVNEHGQKLCVYVNDYKPFFYIKVHDDWKSKDMTQWYRSLDERFQKYITNTKLVEHHKLYGFSGGKKHKFIRLEFDNTSAMSQVKNLWFTNDSEGERCRKNMIYKDVELELYESNIPPLLRYFHVNEISPSGWISYKQNRVLKINEADKKTSCDYEISASYKNIIPEPTKETLVPFNICSFDIEASSSHGDFPLPKKTYKRLASNIVDIFMKQRKYSNAELMSPVFRRCIMKAFGYDNIAEDVDVVYPKKSITKDELDKIIQMYVKVPMNKICMETDEATQELLNIQDIFEDVHSQQQQESTSMDSDVHASQEIGDNVQAWKKKLSYKKKIKNNVNIIEYLLEDTHTREEQLNALDILLMSKLPHLEGDKVTFIGSTFLHYGKKEPHKNHCIVLGDCDDVKGVEIVTANTEREVLLEWTKLIQVENPDIIIGYNIFGFDYEFMFQRSQENDCVSEFLKLSLDKEHISKKDTRESGIQIMNTKVMLASGEYDLRYYNMVGRLQIDMYTYFRRDFNLSSYKLDDVAGQFISDSIKKVECTTDANGKEITKLYSKNLMGLHVDDFIHIELSSFTSDYFKDGKKFRVLDIERDVEVEEKGKMNIYNVIVINEHQDIDKSKNLKWGMAKDDVTPQDIFRLSDEGPKGRAIVAKYCIQDCNLVHHLMNKIDVITGYMEMSNICSVPISFLVFRGQGIKLTSYVAKKCREKDTLMPDLEKPKFASGYEGAIVLPPKCKMYMDNPVACVDYSSLYPSSMISQNYSHDSKVWSKEFDLDGNMLPEKTTGERDEDGTFIYDNVPGYQYIDIEFDTYEYRRASPTSRAEKIKVGSKICRWAQLPDNQKSIMPAILEELLKARKDTRKMIKTEKDPFMQNILDKRQLGYKVTANSLYGQCGARTSTFYEQDVAASTTATGRMMIIYARRMVEEVYGDLEYDTETHGKVRTKAEYVYGDTDSVFFTFNLEDAKTGEKITGQRALEITIEIAQDAADLCTKYLKLPMKLEYEKTLMPFILLSKKRYVGMLYEEDPNKGYLKFMGLSLKRRDSCDYLKDVYGGILNILMREGEGNNLRDAIDYLNKSLLNLIDGKVSMDKLMITKALRSDYKNPQQIGHRVLADRIGERDPGNKPRPGDRMRFVFVVNDKPKALMGDKIETPDYIVENNVQIDYTHYITNQLMKPLQQLFGLAVEDIWTMQKKMSAIKTYRKDVAKLEQDCGGDLELFMKKREKISSAKIKVLLFDKMLETIHNRKHKIQTLDVFFTSKR